MAETAPSGQHIRIMLKFPFPSCIRFLVYLNLSHLANLAQSSGLLSRPPPLGP